ncbi:uncharacterized protein, partial [Musca autumnalis]|uniref:uncharacterized protein n=1 Tax=Musca autumnalis TaxID=221902 RepID=UPI003CFA1D7B
YATKEAATHAIVAVHNTEINQQLVKCSWGKESGEPLHMAALASQALGHGFPFSLAAAAVAAYGQHVAGYRYPPAAATYCTTTTSEQVTNSLQSGQLLHGMQGIASFDQFARYQHKDIHGLSEGSEH